MSQQDRIEALKEKHASLDRAIEQGAHEAPGYALLAGFIRLGCKAAIKISEKV